MIECIEYMPHRLLWGDHIEIDACEVHTGLVHGNACDFLSTNPAKYSINAATRQLYYKGPLLTLHLA